MKYVKQISAVLKAFESYMASEHNMKVLYDPQPIVMAEPHVRLTFVGADENGAFDRLLFQASLVGSGDGPDVFLPALIGMSMRIQDIWSSCRNDGKRWKEIPGDGGTVRIQFKPVQNGSGQFIQNEIQEGEARQWAYTYTEPHMVVLEFKKESKDE
jgi:hypothetical protein